MKPDMKKRRTTGKAAGLLLLVFCLSGSFGAYADLVNDVPVITGGTAAESEAVILESLPQQETAAAEQAIQQTETQGNSEGNGLLSDTPSISGETGGTVNEISSAPQITGKEEGKSEAPQTVSSEVPAVQAPATSKTAGKPGEGIDLGFEIAIPAHDNGAFLTASGSIRLADGSRQVLDYDANLRNPYYRVLRHDRDADGEDCVVVAVHAKRIGDVQTQDGNPASELWLKTKDCTVTTRLPVSETDPLRVAIVKRAMSLLGNAYVYGASGPDSFDCSGFVKYVMDQEGVNVPRTSTEYLSWDGQIAESALRPGDVLARAGHCGIYLGNGFFIHASDSSVGVITETLSVYNTVNRFTNYVNVTGK